MSGSYNGGWGFDAQGPTQRRAGGSAGHPGAAPPHTNDPDSSAGPAMMLPARQGHNTASQSRVDRSAHHGDLPHRVLEVHTIFLNTVAQMSSDIRDAAVHGSARHGGPSVPLVPEYMPPGTTGGSGDSRAWLHSGPAGPGRSTDASALCLPGDAASQVTAASASAHLAVVDGAGPTSSPVPGQPRLSLKQLQAMVETGRWVRGHRFTAQTVLDPADAVLFMHRVLQPSAVPPEAFAHEEVGAQDDNGNWAMQTPPPHWSHIALWALEQFNPVLSSDFIHVQPPQLVLQAPGPPAGAAVRLALGELVGQVHACFLDGHIPLVCGDFNVDPDKKHVVLARTLLQRVERAHADQFLDEHHRFDAWLRSRLEEEQAEYMRLSYLAIELSHPQTVNQDCLARKRGGAVGQAGPPKLSSSDLAIRLVQISDCVRNWRGLELVSLHSDGAEHLRQHFWDAIVAYNLLSRDIFRHCWQRSPLLPEAVCGGSPWSADAVTSVFSRCLHVQGDARLLVDTQAEMLLDDDAMTLCFLPVVHERYRQVLKQDSPDLLLWVDEWLSPPRTAAGDQSVGALRGGDGGSFGGGPVRTPALAPPGSFGGGPVRTSASTQPGSFAGGSARTAQPTHPITWAPGLDFMSATILPFDLAERFVRDVICPTQPLLPLLDEPLWLADHGGQPVQRPSDFVWVHFAVWAMIGPSGHPAWIPDFPSVEALSREPQVPHPFGSGFRSSSFDLRRYIDKSRTFLKFGQSWKRQLRCTDLMRTEAGMLDISHALREHLISGTQRVCPTFVPQLTWWFSLRAQALRPAPHSPIPDLDASAPSQGSATTQVLVSAALPAPGLVSPPVAGAAGAAGTVLPDESRPRDPVPPLQTALADFFRAHASNGQALLPPVVAAVLLSGPPLSSTASGTLERGSVLLAHSLVVLALAELHAGQGGSEVVSGPSFLGDGGSDLVSASPQPFMVAGRAYIERVCEGGMEAIHPDLFRTDFPAAAEYVKAARCCMELAGFITCHCNRRMGGSQPAPCAATACAQIILGAVMCVLSADQLDCSRAIRWYQARVDGQALPDHIAAILAASRPWLCSLDHLDSVFEEDSLLDSILSNFHAGLVQAIAAHPDVLEPARERIRAVTQSRAQSCVPDSGGRGTDPDGDSDDPAGDSDDDGDGGGDSDGHGDGGQDGSYYSSPGLPAPTQTSSPPPPASLPSDPSSRPMLAQPGAGDVAQPRNVCCRRVAGSVAGDAGPSGLLRAPTGNAASPSSPSAQQCLLSGSPAMPSPAHPPGSRLARSPPPSPPSQRAGSPPSSPLQRADCRARPPSPRTSGDGGQSAGCR